MSNENTGGPAFPSPEWSDAHGTVVPMEYGMTLRDYFASKAMQSAFSEGNFTFTLEDYRHLAKVAYAMADSMLIERAIKNDQD